MPKATKNTNPFYSILLVVGVIFAITACAYGVMTVQLITPAQVSGGGASGGLVAFLDEHGMILMMAELAILAVITFAAIGTDDFWSRRAAESNKDSDASPLEQRT